MRALITSLCLVCLLFLNGISITARNSTPKRQKANVAQKAASSSKRNSKTERSEKQQEAKQRALIKKNPRLAALFNSGEEKEMDRFDQPREAVEWYLQKRLPKGARELPVER